MRMKRIMNVLLLVLVMSLLTSNITFAQNLSINVETVMNLKDKEMLSGEKNHLDIGFKVTGPKTIIEDVTLLLTFDQTVKIDEDFLNRNKPEEFTVSLTDKKITMHINRMEAGKYYELPVIFSVENGLINNGHQVTFNLSSLDSNLSINKSESVTINASSPLKINKDYMGLAKKGLENTLGLAPGLTGKWRTKAEILKSNYGQMFIKENTKVIITETFDKDTFEYVRTEGAQEPQILNEGVLVWEFDAPSYEEQKELKTLFFKEFDVIYKVKDGLKLNDKLVDQGSKAVLEFVNVKEELLQDEDEGLTTIYPSAEDTPEVEGNWWIPGHFGPTSPFGDYSVDFEAMNTRPTVYPWATLKYAHQIAALDYGETSVYKSYDISYFINDHLILDEIKTPGRFLYRPNREHGDATYLEEQPIFDVLFYDEHDVLISRFNGVKDNTIITRAEILKDKPSDTRIKKVVYSAQKFVPGMIVDEPEINENTGFTDLPTYSFKIAPTWKDVAKDNMYELKNEMMIEVERKLPQNYKEVYDFRDGVDADYRVDAPSGSYEDFMGWHFLSAPRWAIVTEEEDAYTPTVKNVIELLNHKDGLVYPGSNTLSLKLSNEAVSMGAVLPQVESYFVIPKTIEVHLNNLPQGLKISKHSLNTYNNLYKLEWNNGLFVPREGLRLELDVTIDEELSSLNLFHYTDLSGNDHFKVPKAENPVFQDSLKIERPALLEAFIKDKQLVLTRNNYTVLSDYYIKTEKFVKTEKEPEYSKTATMNPKDIVTYKLDFENKEGIEVDRFALIDVLPHVNDLGITNNIERGSDFNLALNAPLVVDDRFEVLYSESKNPSRDILNDLVDRPGYLKVEGGEEVTWLVESEVKDWQSIYSFVIRLKDNEKLDIDEQFSIEFTSKIPQEIQVKNDVYAHNSFALTANGSPIVEPLQVSVKLQGDNEKPELPPLEPETPTPSTPSKPPQTGIENLTLTLNVIIIASIGILFSLYKTKAFRKKS